MSDFTSKNHKGLMEAYASIYNNQPEQIIEEQVDLEVYSENVEVDPDFLVDVIVEHLITEGYTKTENQALDIIPHISDAWLDNIIESIVIKEHFLDCVNSLVEEGYDLSSYTWDELYEDYNSHLNNVILEEYGNINEAIPLAIPAAGAAAPYILPALGAAAYGIKGLLNRRQKTDPASQRWLETGSYETRKQTPKQQRDAAQQRRQQAAAQRVKQQQAKPAKLPEPKVTTVASPAAKPQAPAQPSGGTTPPPSGPTPPKPPKGPGPFGKAKELFKKGLGLQPGQSMAKELGKATIQKAGEVVKGTPGAVKGFFTSPKPAVRALKALGFAELGSYAGQSGKSPTGEVLKGVGSILKGVGGAAQQAPKEAQAIQRGVSEYQKAKEQKTKPEEPKQKKLKFGPDGSVIGFE